MLVLQDIMSAMDLSNTIYQGRVKWFNNKAGYGFVTIIDGASVGDKIGADVFAHHSAISVDEEQYKYLVQGEYIEFTLSSVEATADYKYQATNIKGIKGGKLLCETRNEIRATMPARPVGRQNTRSRGSGPRDGHDDSGEWTMSTSKPNTVRREHATSHTVTDSK
jgi:cold shock CspA family protein